MIADSLHTSSPSYAFSFPEERVDAAGAALVYRVGIGGRSFGGWILIYRWLSKGIYWVSPANRL